MSDLKYDIIQTLAILPAVGKWHKKPNLVEWGNRKARYDIRGWNKGRSEMTRGITLSEEEMEYLKESIGGVEI